MGAPRAQIDETAFRDAVKDGTRSAEELAALFKIGKSSVYHYKKIFGLTAPRATGKRPVGTTLKKFRRAVQRTIDRVESHNDALALPVSRDFIDQVAEAVIEKIRGRLMPAAN